MVKQYALYKGDLFITCGTIAEIAAEQRVKPETVHFWKTPAYQKRIRPALKSNGWKYKTLVRIY